MENKKLTKEELQEIKNLNEEKNKLTFNFGRLKTDMILVEAKMKELVKMEEDMVAKFKGNETKAKKMMDKLNKTNEDAFGYNKYKIIEDTGGDPNILNEVFESGVLGDEEEAAALVEEYTKNKGLGLTVETMQKNKMAAAMSKISGLASNNEEHKQSTPRSL